MFYQLQGNVFILEVEAGCTSAIDLKLVHRDIEPRLSVRLPS